MGQFSRLAVATVLASTLLGIPAAEARKPVPRMKGSCVASFRGNDYTGTASLARTDPGSSHSAYYVGAFGTKGTNTYEPEFELYQALQGDGGPGKGWPSWPRTHVVSKKGFQRNLWTTLDPKETSYAFVWVTRNPSVNGDPREKLALFEVAFNEGSKRFGCTIVFRQPS